MLLWGQCINMKHSRKVSGRISTQEPQDSTFLLSPSSSVPGRLRGLPQARGPKPGPRRRGSGQWLGQGPNSAATRALAAAPAPPLTCIHRLPTSCQPACSPPLVPLGRNLRSALSSSLSPRSACFQDAWGWACWQEGNSYIKRPPALP